MSDFCSPSKHLLPLREQYPDAYIIRDMDDILMAHSNSDVPLKIFAYLETSCTTVGLWIAPEESQKNT